MKKENKITSTSTPTIDLDDIQELDLFLKRMTGSTGSFMLRVEKLVRTMEDSFDYLKRNKNAEIERLNNEIEKLRK